jgi:hypothetical protein
MVLVLEGRGYWQKRRATRVSGGEVRRVRGTGENEDGKEVVEGREGAGYDGPSYALAT